MVQLLEVYAREELPDMLLLETNICRFVSSKCMSGSSSLAYTSIKWTNIAVMWLGKGIP